MKTVVTEAKESLRFLSFFTKMTRLIMINALKTKEVKNAGRQIDKTDGSNH